MHWQVDEIVNVFTHWEEQQGIPPPGIDRMLFLTMTDGVHTVHGMESSEQPLEAIQVCACAPLGLKVSSMPPVILFIPIHAYTMFLFAIL
jgi:hypothetical protein